MRHWVAIATAVVALATLAGCAREPRRQVLQPQEAPPPVASFVPVAPYVPPTTQPTPVRPANQPVAAQKLAELYPGTGRSIDPQAVPRRGDPQPGDITLSFADTDVREVVQVMLRDILGVNYVIDPAVRGNVTLDLARPIRRDDVLTVLESTLEAVGASLIRQGGVYRVLPAQQAGREAPLVAGGEGAGFAVSVFPLSYIGAEEMRTVLQPLLPEGRVARADAQRGLVMVAGNARERRIAAETVRLFDVDQLAGTTALLESLANVDAKTAVFELDTVFGGLEKGPLAGQVRLIPIERLNAVLVLAKQPRYIEEARNWIARLDRTQGAAGRRLYVYYAQNGKAEDLAKTLKEIFQPGSAGPPRPRAVAFAGNQRLPSAGGAPVRMAVGTGTEEPAEGVEAAPEAAGGEQGDGVRITANEKQNAILILATQQEYELIGDVLSKLDLQPLAVMIEAQIVEITLRDQLRFGVQYFLKTGGLDITKAGATVLSAGANSFIQPTFPGFAFTLADEAQTRFVLDTLSQLTEVNVVSAPQVMVLDNQSARLRVGDQVPIVVQSATSNLTSDSRTVNAIEYRDTGVTLDVTPRVNASGLVTLEIAQEVSDVVRTTTSNIDSPTIQQRKIASTVAVHSGETIALGGLIRNQASDDKGGVPGLVDLPIVGPLFGAQASDLRRTELLVLLRPAVIRNTQEARSVTDDLKQRYIGLLESEQNMPQPRRFERGEDDPFGLGKLLR